MCPDDDALKCLVAGLSSQRMYRDLFWLMARCAPFTLLALAACLALSRYRRFAIAALIAGAAGAIALAIVFHYTYATTIWGGHASAIRYLDTAALWAGFAASAYVYACGYATYLGVRRFASGA